MVHSLYETLLEQHLRILADLQYESGLFAASKKGIATGYDKAWLRDNFYECLAFEVLGDYTTVRRTYRAILEIFQKHEYKIDRAIAKKPLYTHEYIHARYHPVTFDEFWEEWGNKQNDSIGCILFELGELEARGVRVIENEEHRRITQKLVWYLSTLQYWHDEDSGMWEEDQEVHASSVGACLAGLESIRRVEGIEVPEALLKKGREQLALLLPRESARKFVDLALLSLLWPYGVVDEFQAKTILDNVEYHLLRQRGVIRYKGDKYYNKNHDGWSEEAEWTFGLSWLAIIYEKRGQYAKAERFLEAAKKTLSKNGIPELYFSNSTKFNANTPLGWSESLFIVALYEFNLKHVLPQSG